ncbi:unnamed protein product [Adineta steineri]|uniref:Uncharacterized protein n=1 Tax=Adineta steineri TaxID=433720 RepID=A0A814V088_9BILA|nr:unnamed protein product [Adineta steineri]
MSLLKLASYDQAKAAMAGGTTSQSAASSRRNSEWNADDTPPDSLPRSAYYIVIVEGCERFTFAGLRVILLLYFMHYFNTDHNTATSYYHLFSFTYHFTPIFGAILSDGYIGRYYTILILSFVYFIGTVMLSITAIPDIGHKRLWGPILGLLFIALGTGGIKPCVNAFGADQIPSPNTEQLTKLFSFYYFAVNFGALISTIIVPLVRSDVQCFGYDCYSLAFAIPAALMLFSIVIFIIGTPLYKRIPPKENMIAKFAAVIWRTIRNGVCRPKSERKEHWLDYADDKHIDKDIQDVRSVFRVSALFLPLVAYHALHSQKGSRWTYQATLMDGSIGPFGKIQPDQMQVLNYILILLFIPLFERIIYPAAARFNWLTEPLQRIYVGLILTVVSFIVAAMLQNTIMSKADAVPVRNFMHIYNGYHCPLFVSPGEALQPGQTMMYPCKDLLDQDVLFVSVCDIKNVGYKLPGDKICPSVLVVSKNNTALNGTGIELITLTNPFTSVRGVREYALLRLVSVDSVLNTTVKLTPNEYSYNITDNLVPTAYQSVLGTSYRVKNKINDKESTNSFNVHLSGVYTVLLVNTTKQQLRAVLIEDVPPFTVHMFWQIFQYIILTCAEILVAITVLIFAYSEAPRRYKVVILSFWLISSSLGDLLVIAVTESHITSNQTTEFLLFALIMAFATFIFGAMAVHYKQRPLRFESLDDLTEEQHLLDKKPMSH